MQILRVLVYSTADSSLVASWRDGDRFDAETLEEIVRRGRRGRRSLLRLVQRELPMLRAASIGSAKLALEKRGLALPSYSDSAEVAYVLQGETS